MLRALRNIKLAPKMIGAFVIVSAACAFAGYRGYSSVTYTQWALIGGSIVGSIGLGLGLTLSITRPLSRLTAAADRLAQGDIRQTVDYQGGDEIGQLADSFRRTIASLAKTAEEMRKTHEAQVAGSFDIYSNTEQFHGIYRTLIECANSDIKIHVDNILLILTTIISYAEGDFTPVLKKLPGKQIVANEKMDLLRGNLLNLIADFERLNRAAVEGKLSTRADASKHQGDYRKIVQGVNDTLDAIIGPLNMAAHNFDRISKGDVPAKITDNYNGDFNTIKNNLNTCIDAINTLVADAGMLHRTAVEGKLSTRADAAKHHGDYRKIVEGINQTLDAILEPVHEASEVIQQIAAGDLTVRVQGNYQGENAAIKTNLNKMATDLEQSIAAIGKDVTALASASENLYGVSTQLDSSAKESAAQANVVSAAAEEVSKNVQTVATGTEEMSASIREIANNASGATRVAGQAVSLADHTNATVAKLGESSNEIGKVIKVITSIAEQTNLLALNATIEAARAGEAGKGFAVVANEVKELAKETAKATEEIRQKIDAIQSDTHGAVDGHRADQRGHQADQRYPEHDCQRGRGADGDDQRDHAAT